jgi:hypothetical protein
LLSGTAIKDTYSSLLATPASSKPLQCSSSGWQFDGSSSYASVDPWEWGGTTSFEVLVKHNAFTDYSRVFDFSNGQSSDNVALYNTPFGSQVGFGVFQGDVQSLIYAGNYNNYNTPDPTHIVVTADSGKLAVYVDGFLQGAPKQFANGRGSIPRTLRSVNYLGVSPWNGMSAYLDGDLSYLRIWHGVALMPDEVCELYATRDIKDGEEAFIDPLQISAEVAATCDKLLPEDGESNGDDVDDDDVDDDDAYGVDEVMSEETFVVVSVLAIVIGACCGYYKCKQQCQECNEAQNRYKNTTSERSDPMPNNLYSNDVEMRQRNAQRNASNGEGGDCEIDVNVPGNANFRETPLPPYNEGGGGAAQRPLVAIARPLEPVQQFGFGGGLARSQVPVVRAYVSTPFAAQADVNKSGLT